MSVATLKGGEDDSGIQFVFDQAKGDPPKKIHYNVKWVQQLYQFYDKPAGSDLTDQEVSDFLVQLSKHCKQWHLQIVWDIYLQDRKNEVPGVYLPYALERKYPNAGKEWQWQWVFPSKSLSMDPRTKIIRRHHLYPDNLQRNLRKAVKAAAISKRITVHTLRHYAESRTMPSNHILPFAQAWFSSNNSA